MSEVSSYITEALERMALPVRVRLLKRKYKWAFCCVEYHTDRDWMIYGLSPQEATRAYLTAIKELTHAE